MLGSKIRAILVAVIFIVHFPGSIFSTQAPFKILLTNDDGVDAPGIAALFETLSKIASITVAAPARNQSAVGHGITTRSPILVDEINKKDTIWYAIDALPATCVRLALESLVTDKPDLVVSGINRGENLGVITYYSGTVACAREAAFVGIPAIAVSLESGEVMDYDAAAEFVAGFVQKIKDKAVQPGVFLNINLPALPKDKIRGVFITKQDTRPSIELFERRLNPGGKIYFWNIYKPLGQGDEKNDVWAIRNGYISITPLHFDQTDLSAFENLEDLILPSSKKDKS